jgi:hypothetical protein
MERLNIRDVNFVSIVGGETQIHWNAIGMRPVISKKRKHIEGMGAGVKYLGTSGAAILSGTKILHLP